MGKLIEARVLVAIKELGVEANHVLVASEKRIAELAKAGFVDPVAEAVAYAKEIGAEVVKLVDEEPVNKLVQARQAAKDETAAADAENAKADATATANVDTQVQTSASDAVADSANA